MKITVFLHSSGKMMKVLQSDKRKLERIGDEDETNGGLNALKVWTMSPSSGTLHTLTLWTLNTLEFTVLFS